MTGIQVYHPKSVEGFEIAQAVGDDAKARRQGQQTLSGLPARNPGSAWVPIPMRVTTAWDNRPASRSLMPPVLLKHAPVLILRDEAIESVGRLLAEHGDVLPLDGANARLAVFVAPLVADALIEQESVLQRDPPPTDWYWMIERGVFNRRSVGNLQAFVVPEGRSYALCLCEPLVSAIEETGDTTGTTFELLGVVR